MSSNMKHRRLQELGESDFEIVDGQPDIRGWDVKNEAGQKIGEVEELILDAQQRKVRYLVVEMDDNDFDLDDREVLLPIGMAELHKEDDDVIIRSIGVEQLSALPEYDEDHLTPEVERQICTALGRSGMVSTSPISDADHDATFYDHEHFNDNNLYRQRLPVSGFADVEMDTSGYSLRDRTVISGSEVGGYTGDAGSYDRERTTGNPGGVVRENEIRNESAVPVNRNKDQEDQWRKETNIDNLTGDNNRGISDDYDRPDETGRTKI